MNTSTPFVCDDCKAKQTNWYGPCPHAPTTEPAYTEQDLQKSFDVAQNAGYCIVTDSGVTYPDFDKDSDLVKSYAAEFSRIRSEARAGMREACANKIIVFSTLGGWLDSPSVVSEHIRSLPDLAADEAIERIKSQVRQDQLRTDIGRIRCWLDKSGAGLEEVISNPGLDPTAKGLAEAVILLTERIKAAARLEEATLWSRDKFHKTHSGYCDTLESHVKECSGCQRIAALSGKETSQ